MFLTALNVSCAVVLGNTSALAALASVCVSATSKRANAVILSLSLRSLNVNALSNCTLVVYMIRLNALAAFDSLVCAGLVSARVVTLVCDLSLVTQAAVCASLR